MSSDTFAYGSSASSFNPAPGRPDPGYGDEFQSAISWVNQTPDVEADDGPPTTWINDGPTSQESGTPGTRLAAMLTPQFANAATVLALHERLLLHAGADAQLNASEGSKALLISEDEMERIIENMGGEDAETVKVADMLSELEPFVSQDSPPRVSNKGIDDWIMEMKGGKNNFFAWAGEDGQLNRSEFRNLIQTLMADYDGEYAEQLDDMDGIGSAEADQMHELRAGSDGKIDPNEFAEAFATLDDDGKFDWATAQEKVAVLALQLGPASGSSTSSNNSGSPYTVTYPGGGNSTWTPYVGTDDENP